jgi:hypothetical protein
MCLQVNLGEIKMNLLQAVQGTQRTLEFQGKSLRLVDVFDFRYPGMMPLTCIFNDGTTLTQLSFRACLLRQGDTYMLPVRA